MAVINFDASQHAPINGNEPIPSGWYKFIVKNMEHGATKDGRGEKLTTYFEVIEGPYMGRLVVDNFNLRNQNPKAEEIGRGQFSALCHAVGVLQVPNTEMLHNIPFWGRAKLEPAQYDQNGNVAYDAKNSMSSFKHIQDPPKQENAAQSSTQTQAPQFPPANQQPPQTQQQPWMNQQQNPNTGQQVQQTQPLQQNQNPPPQSQPTWANQQVQQPPQQNQAPQSPPQQPYTQGVGGDSGNIAPPWMQQNQNAPVQQPQQVQNQAPQQNQPPQQNQAPGGMPPWMQGNQ